MLSIIDTELIIINGDILCLGQGFIKNLKNLKIINTKK